MLQFAPGVKVYLACKPVDMRRGFDGLAADVAQTLHADPYSGAAFVFRSNYCLPLAQFYVYISPRAFMPAIQCAVKEKL